MQLRVKRPSPALVIALVALFVAIGGVAWAVQKAPKNSVVSTLDSVDAANVLAASISASGELTAATQPGTTVEGPLGGNLFQVTFSRSVQGCVPVASGKFSPEVVTLLDGTAHPNVVDVTNFGAAKDVNLVVVC